MNASYTFWASMVSLSNYPSIKLQKEIVVINSILYRPQKKPLGLRGNTKKAPIIGNRDFSKKYKQLIHFDKIHCTILWLTAQFQMVKITDQLFIALSNSNTLVQSLKWFYMEIHFFISYELSIRI